MVFGKRKAGEQGGREATAPEFARRLIESMHRVEVWGKLKELEFYMHLSRHSDLNRDERDAVADCLECKFAEGDFDSLQRDFMSKLTNLERTVRGRYDHVIEFLRPTTAPSQTELTNYALHNLDQDNVKYLNDMLIHEWAYRIIKVRENIINAIANKQPLSFEDTREVTLDIQEFVSYLFPWQRQILFLHLLTSKHKPHPAEVAWAQDALMSSGIAEFVSGMIHRQPNMHATPEWRKIGTSIDLVVGQATYHQPGWLAATLRGDAAELDKAEMDVLIGHIREAQESMKSQV